MYKGVRDSLCWFYIIFFFKYPMKMKNLVSLRPNFFIFIGYLKMGTEGEFKRTPWNPSGSFTAQNFQIKLLTVPLDCLYLHKQCRPRLSALGSVTFHLGPYYLFSWNAEKSLYVHCQSTGINIKGIIILHPIFTKFSLMIYWLSSNMGHVWTKTRSSC